MPIVYGVDYQGIYTAVTFTRHYGLLTKIFTSWRAAISDDFSLLPVRSDYVITLTDLRVPAYSLYGVRDRRGSSL